MNGTAHTPGETAGGSIKRFAVVMTDDNDVVETTGNTSQAYGVAQYSADEGDKLDVVCGGPTKAIAGGTIDKGESLMPAADGEVVADDGATENRHLCGYALEAAVEGDIFYINFNPDNASQ